MKNSRLYGCVLMTGILLAGCVSSSTKQSADKESELVGNDKDDHGCIASAGYIWSELLQNCIRPFEKGVKLVSAIDSSATSAAFLVFNADSSQVELFLPEDEQQPVLSRERLPNGETVFEAEGEEETVLRDKGNWIIRQADRIIYRENSADGDAPNQK